MARFLSDEWFADIRRHQPAAGGPGPGPVDAALVVEEVVPDAPGGEVRYRVVIAGAAARIAAKQQPEPDRDPAGDGAEPDLTITCDWETAASLAQGRLSAQAALMDGRLRIRGNLSRLAGGAAQLAGLDPVPPEVRARTTYERP